VGNPVNLIDANNTIGREYMNALLNAMKRSNGGTPDELSLAMQRLEKAYQLVEESIESGEIALGKKDEFIPPLPPNEPVAPQPVSTPPPMPEPETVPPVVTSQPVPEPVVPPATPPVSPTPITPATPPPAPTQSASPAPQIASTPDYSAPPPPAAPSVTPLPESLAAKLAKENAARSSLLAQNVAEAEKNKTPGSEDPLYTDAIDSGLEQLLSEWKLFRSSGLFGTGPSGYMHPLYKALAPLPMAAVIAGRFEGVTPEVRQSITDYMNGWRYEQNVVHEMNETFEHYLRRVIQEVLSRQNQPPKA
jgi:hypothetical protein